MESKIEALTLSLAPFSDVPNHVLSARNQYDRNVTRWPLHIPLIYPFVRTGLFETAIEKLGNLKAKPFTLTMSPLGHFSTAREHVVFSEPVQGKDEMVQVYQDVCRVLQLDPTTVRPYSPKLLIGRFDSEDALQNCLEELREKFKTPFEIGIDSISILSSTGRDVPFEENYVIPLGGAARLVKQALPEAPRVRVEDEFVLYVGNLMYSSTVDDVRSIFPTAKSIKISMDESRRSKGFAFLAFETQDDLMDVVAQNERQQFELDGRQLRVSIREKRERQQ